MSYRRLAEALLQGRPYFGPALRALQGPPVRQKYILPVVKAVAEKGSVEVLEVGSWAGASAISWASALKELGLSGHVTCVDSWLPYFDLEKEKTHHYRRMNHAAEVGLVRKLFEHNVSSAGFSDTIAARAGKSRKVLPKLAPHSFDVIYLDGSHTLEDVLFDVRQAKRLVRPNGIICGDDLEIQLKDLDPAEVEAAAGTGRDFHPSTRAGTYYHPGVTLAVARELGEVCAWDGFWAVRFSGKECSPVALDVSASEIPVHVASATMKLEADTSKHQLISYQGRYFAVAKQLGPPDIIVEFFGEEDLPPLLFTGGTLAEVREKVEDYDEARATGQLTPGESDLLGSPQLMESYRGFNIVYFKSRVYGLRESIGEVDLSVNDVSTDPRYSGRDAIIGDSSAEVKARIDAVEAERALVDLKARVRTQLDEI